MKRLFLLGLAGTLSILILTTGCGKKDDKEVNKNTVINNGTVLDEQTKDEFKISKLAISYENGMTDISGTATNISNTSIQMTALELSLYDKNNSLIVTTVVTLGNTVEPKVPTQFHAQVTSELKDVSRVEYRVIK